MFWAQTDLIHGIFSSPYSELTLGKFEFPVGANSATRKKVSPQYALCSVGLRLSVTALARKLEDYHETVRNISPTHYYQPR